MSIEFKCPCGTCTIVHNTHVAYEDVLKDVKERASFLCTKCYKPLTITVKDL